MEAYFLLCTSCCRDILQELVHFYTTLVSRLRSGSLFPFLRALSAVIHQTGSSNFYSLPLLESSLYCLQTVTRTRLWYSEVDALSVYQLGAQLVVDLKQVGVGTVLTSRQATPVSEGAYINTAHMISCK